jgi:hypothetical protein
MRDLYPHIGTELSKHVGDSLIALGVVLLSAAMLNTTDVVTLVRFTGYSANFVSAVAFNMTNTKLWRDGRYDTSSWRRADETIDEELFYDHVATAEGDLLTPACDNTISAEPCWIFWDERRRK